MKPIYIVLIIIILAVLGGGVFIWQSSSLTNPIQDKQGITIGTFLIDQEEIRELQKAVDEGHQPWRLDALMVAESEAIRRYGFNTDDDFKLKSEENNMAKIQVMHDGIYGRDFYIIKLMKPVLGETKIWVIKSIYKIQRPS